MTEDIDEFDNRPGIFLAHEMPDNIKIAALSDAAFRTLIKAWCYCSRVRTDGLIPQSVWEGLGTAKVRQELMSPPALAPTRQPLVKAVPGGVMAHDYLKHNRSSEEIDAVASKRADSGSLGNHTRWHVGRRKYKADCEFCLAEGRIANAS